MDVIGDLHRRPLWCRHRRGCPRCNLTLSSPAVLTSGMRLMQTWFYQLARLRASSRQVNMSLSNVAIFGLL